MKINQLEHLIGNLKEEDRLLLIMKYADGLKIEELSELTGLGQSAVKMRLKRIKENVNTMYQSEFSN